MKTSFALQQAQAQLGIKKLRKHQIKPILKYPGRL